MDRPDPLNTVHILKNVQAFLKNVQPCAHEASKRLAPGNSHSSLFALPPTKAETLPESGIDPADG
jgi:hypothetical protein